MRRYLRAELFRSAAIIAAMALAAPAARANVFTNGDAEAGDFSGWTLGSGYWGSPAVGSAPANLTAGGTLTPDKFLPGGQYDIGTSPPGVFTVTNAGTDANTGGVLSTVYAGSHSFKLNDANNNYSVSAMKQTVTNYSGTNVYFAWAAVLQGSHGLTDSDNFSVLLIDETTSTTLYTASYSSASAAGSNLFQQNGGTYFTNWQVENIDVSDSVGHTLALEVMAADCNLGGHWGYVYLDGFGEVVPPSDLPEPASMSLFGLGMAGLALLRRRKG